MDEKLYTRALKFLTRRPRSEKEVRENLKKVYSRHSGKRASERIQNQHEEGSWTSLQTESSVRGQDDVIEEIINFLKKQNFLNDLEFAKWWLEQRQILKPMGWRVLELELKQKGIAKEIIEELRIMNYALRGKNELEMARELAEKRMKRVQGAPKDEIYRKLGGFLARRGFDLDTIKAVIDQCLQK